MGLTYMKNYLGSTISSLSFKKSLWKGYLRRRFPYPWDVSLSRPVFVVGSSRSGTTILTDVLSLSPELHEFSEHPIVRRHMWCMVKNPDAVIIELPKLEITLVRLSGITPDKRLLEKSPGHSLLVEPLSNYFPDAKFIHIVRDARDSAFSMLKHEWIADELREIHPVFWFDLLPLEYREEWKTLPLWERAILRWALYVSEARRISHQSEKYLEIKYENLCLHPQETFSKICLFLGLNESSIIEEGITRVDSTKAFGWKRKALSDPQLEFHSRVLSSFELQL